MSTPLPDNQYPSFEGGATLTAADLNQLQAYLDGRDRQLGRQIGFGISCGLRGTVVGTTLTIGSGLAVDQRGATLVLDAARTVALPPAAPHLSTAACDLVDPAAGGFSVVLEASDTATPSPSCGTAGCDKHSVLHTRGVALRVVAGRITGPRFGFANEPLLAVEPMRLSITSAPQGSFVDLRTALVTRLTNGGAPLIDPALVTALAGVQMAASDLPGVKGYKAGFLNQVLFATLDLLRAQMLLAVPCSRPTATPGVVLGWLTLVGTTWTWDCAYRHAWEPPAGLTLALLGGTCSDPAGVLRDEVEGLIAGYAPPDPPPPPPAGGGGTVFDPGEITFCPQGMIRVGTKCVNIYYPPVEVPDSWTNPWIVDPLGPVWNPPLTYWDPTKGQLITPPNVIYGTPPMEYLEAGLLTVLPAIGLDAEVAATGLAGVIEGHGATPNILVRTADQLRDVAGYETSGSINLADTLVLTQDANGRVVGTGRISATYSARQVGTALPAAVDAAHEALDASHQVGAELGALTVTLGDVQDDVAGFREFEQATTTWQQEVSRTLDGVGSMVDGRVDARLGNQFQDVQRRLATVEGSITVLSRSGPGNVGGVGPGAQGVQRLDQDFARGMVKFAETITAGLGEIVTDDTRRTLGRYVGDATRVAAQLEVVAAGGDPIAIGDAAVALLGTLRTAVKSAGVDPQVGRRLDAQFNEVKGLLG